jgi:transcriptional regulator with XRE-family HTH domain
MPAPDDPFLLGLGDAIRELRRERGVTQEQLGADSGIHRNYIGGIERAERKPSLVQIGVLAVTLRVRPSDLVARAEHKAEGYGASWPPAPDAVSSGEGSGSGSQG